MSGYNLNLRLAVALREDLLKTRLEDADIVVNDSLLFSRAIIAHDTDESKISRTVS